MNLFRTLVILSGFWLLTLATWCESSCPVLVRSAVEITGPDLTLADLLRPESCPERLAAAARIHLGAAPLAGSVRVFEGDQLRNLLRRIANGPDANSYPAASLPLPERIVVRRARLRSSCRDIERQLAYPRIPDPHNLDPKIADSKITDSNNADPKIDGQPAPAVAAVPEPVLDPEVSDPALETACGAAGRISQSASLVITRKFWDAAAQSWDLVARCTDASDCVPFLVRARGQRAARARPVLLPGKTLPLFPLSGSGLKPGLFQESFVVRPGDRASVLWDQDGIRVVVSAICMDKGRRGDTVRARFAAGGRIIRAIVVNPGSLRIPS